MALVARRLSSDGVCRVSAVVHLGVGACPGLLVCVAQGSSLLRSRHSSPAIEGDAGMTHWSRQREEASARRPACQERQSRSARPTSTRKSGSCIPVFWNDNFVGVY